MELNDQELDELIATLVLTNDLPSREVIHALAVEVRDLRRRWKAFHWSFPFLTRWMTWLSRRR